MGDKWKHTALLVIDMQNDFILEDGLMRVNGAEAIVPNVVKAVEIARQRGILVVWVVREHDPLGRDVERFRRHLYPPGKVGPTSKGSEGAELVDGLEIKDGDYKLVKTRFSAFFATHLHSFLRSARTDSLVIVGVQTPNCIRQTVFDAVALDYESVTVIVDATAAATPDIHIGWRADTRLAKASTKTFATVINCMKDPEPMLDNSSYRHRAFIPNPVLDISVQQSPTPLETNIFDMKNVGVATPSLQEWSEADA